MEHECRGLTWDYGQKSEQQFAVFGRRLQEDQAADIRQHFGPAVRHFRGEGFGELRIAGRTMRPVAILRRRPKSSNGHDRDRVEEETAHIRFRQL
jgi:hypothetical protein